MSQINADGEPEFLAANPDRRRRDLESSKGAKVASTEGDLSDEEATLFRTSQLQPPRQRILKSCRDAIYVAQGKALAHSLRSAQEPTLG